jgi:AraC-like DNA-binding protein
LYKSDAILAPVPGILHARAAEQKFRFSSAAPTPALAPFVEHFWFVEWDLRGQDPYEQHVLPYPSVNVTFKPGRCRVAGVPKGRFSEVLAGAGRVFGVRFRPAGFRPFAGGPVSAFTDRFVPVSEVFGQELADGVLAADNDGALALMEAFLIQRAPTRPDPDAALADAIADRIATDPGVTRVADLAAEFGVGMRRLQRLFADYVGVGPKWVIRRYRLHEAAARAAEGGPVDWVGLAADLGFTDQAHLTHAFTAIVGVPPARYAKAQ